MKRYVTDPTRVYCKECKTKYDLQTLRERKDYKAGICPKCKGFYLEN